MITLILMLTTNQFSRKESEYYMEYFRGEFVLNPRMIDWGIGQIVADSKNGLVKAIFVQVGEKLISTKHVQLQRIENPGIDPLIPETPEEKDSFNKKEFLCKNCGEPARIVERTSSKRAALGWCVRCFEILEKSKIDVYTESGRKWADESRTIDGIPGWFRPH